MKSDNEHRVEVLLATYNAGDYLAPQLESILNQSYSNINIVIRDDGSIDNTLKTIRNYSKFNENIEYIDDVIKSKGHVSNFFALCASAIKNHSDYFCFSDQDDVWRRDKIEVLSEKMKELEKLYGDETPILVHSDLTVVDSELKVISPSFVNYQGLPSPNMHTFPELLFQNIVTGCASMFNRALLEKAMPIPEQAIVHDWWFALCAKYFGIIGYVDAPLVQYRQHGKNSIGAISMNDRTNFFKGYIYKIIFNYPRDLLLAMEQANCLLLKIKQAEKLDSEIVNNIEMFARIRKQSLYKRVRYADEIMIRDASFLGRMFQYFTFWLIKWL